MPKRSSAFMIFTRDWQKTNRPNMAMEKAVVGTGKIWRKMSEEERRPYEERADPCSVLWTEPVAHLVAENRSEEAEVMKMKCEIDFKVRKALNNKDLENQRFNVFMFNYFNKTESAGSYLPAEVSLCQFSLQEGIVQFYSTLINPNSLIFGSLYDAQQHSLSTHGLPLPPNALGTTGFHQLYSDILKFIDDDDAHGNLPTVYTFTDKTHIVSSCLRYLNSSAPDGSEIKVYSIHYLFYQMKCATCELSGLVQPKNQFITNAYFERDYFEYYSGLACDFHEEENRSKYCAQSRVIRWSYMFFDYMCADLAIKLIPSKHFPQSIKPNFTVIEPKHSSKSTTSSYSKPESTFSSINPDESSIDHSILKWEAMKIGRSVAKSSYMKMSSSKSSYTVDSGHCVKTLSEVLRDGTKFSGDINDTEHFPNLSSKKKKPNNPNSGAPIAAAVAITAKPKSTGFFSKAVGKKKFQPMLYNDDDGSDESFISPSTSCSFDLQSLASSSISAPRHDTARGKGKYASTISKLSGTTSNHFGAAAVDQDFNVADGAEEENKY